MAMNDNPREEADKLRNEAKSRLRVLLSVKFSLEDRHAEVDRLIDCIISAAILEASNLINSDPSHPERLRLIRIGVAASLPTGSSEADWLISDGWTVEKIAKANPSELEKYSGHIERSEYWIKNAKEITES